MTIHGGNVTARPWAQGTGEWGCECDEDEFPLRRRDWVLVHTRTARDLYRGFMTGLRVAATQLCLATAWPVADAYPKPVLSRLLDIIERGIRESRARFAALRFSGDAAVNCEPSPLEQELSDFAGELAPEEAGRLRILVMGRAKKLDCDANAKLFPIMQQALLNALRYSNATRVEAEIEYLPYSMRVVVRDNGVGVSANSHWWEQESHAGLAALSEQASNIGAHFRVWSSPAAGTELEISLPA